MWVCSGSAIERRDRRGQRPRLVLIDAEHSPNGLESILAQLHAVSAYPGGAARASAVRRHRRDQAVPRPRRAEPARADGRLPRAGRRARAGGAVSRRTACAASAAPSPGRPGGTACPATSRARRASISLFVQIESAAAVERVAEIAAVDGVDAIFVGPADLAASMGRARAAGPPRGRRRGAARDRRRRAAGKPAGVNAFAPDAAERYLAAGAAFVLSVPTSRSSPGRPRRSPTGSSERCVRTADGGRDAPRLAATAGP